MCSGICFLSISVHLLYLLSLGSAVRGWDFQFEGFLFEMQKGWEIEFSSTVPPHIHTCWHTSKAGIFSWSLITALPSLYPLYHQQVLLNCRVTRKYQDKRYRLSTMMLHSGLMGLKTLADWQANHSKGEAQLVWSCFQTMADVAKRETEWQNENQEGYSMRASDSFATPAAREITVR